jgi:hypothetical protein
MVGPETCMGLDCIAPLMGSYREALTRVTLLPNGDCRVDGTAGCNQDGSREISKRGDTSFVFDISKSALSLGDARPADCLNVEESDNGLEFASCPRKQGYELLALAHDGKWQSIGVTPQPMRHAALASDGSLLFASQCGVEAQCAAYVRAPGEFSTVVALVKIQASAQKALRSLPNGELMIVAQPQGVVPGSYVMFRSSLSRKGPKTVFPRGSAKALSQCFQDQGATKVAGDVLVTFSKDKTTYVGPRALVSCAQRILGDKSLGDTGNDTIYFRNWFSSFDVHLVTGAGQISTIAKNVVFDGNLRDASRTTDYSFTIGYKSFRLDVATGKLVEIKTP